MFFLWWTGIMLGKWTGMFQTRNTFQHSRTASRDVATHVGCTSRRETGACAVIETVAWVLLWHWWADCWNLQAICKNGIQFRRSLTAFWDAVKHLGCYVTEGELRLCNNGKRYSKLRRLDSGYRADVIQFESNHVTSSARPEYRAGAVLPCGLVGFVPHAVWRENELLLRHWAVSKLRFLSLRFALANSPEPHTVLNFPLFLISLRGGFLHDKERLSKIGTCLHITKGGKNLANLAPFNPFTIESDHIQISPAASPEI